MTAKALSIQQPWAWAITDLDKRTENRKRATTYRGEVFLHASAKARPIDNLIETLDQWPDDATRAMHAWKKGEMPLGSIVGVAQLYGCVGIAECGYRPQGHGSIVQDRWAEGPLGYLLRNVVKLPTPVPCKGALQFWKVPSKVEAEVRRQLAMIRINKVSGLDETKRRLEGTNPAQTETTVPPNETPAPPVGTAPAEAPAAQDPAPNSPEDLGYTQEDWADFSPDQRHALRVAFNAITMCRALQKKLEEDYKARAEAAKEAKERVDRCKKDIDELFDKLEEIANGAVAPRLPGMGPGESGDTGTGGHGDTGMAGEGKPTDVCVCNHPRSCHPDNGPCQDADCKKGCGGFVLLPPEKPAGTAEDIPADLLNAAMEHVVICHEKGKGLDVNSLSLVLFSNRKKENRPRCEAVLARLVRDGLIVADESSDDGKARYLPAGKE